MMRTRKHMTRTRTHSCWQPCHDKRREQGQRERASERGTGGEGRDPSLGHESAAANVLNLLGGADIARGAHAQGRASEPGAASDLRSPGPMPHATQPAATTGWRECAEARQGGEQEREPQEPVVYLRAMAHCLFSVAYARHDRRLVSRFYPFLPASLPSFFLVFSFSAARASTLLRGVSSSSTRQRLLRQAACSLR